VTLYLDSSALMKRYVEEPESDLVERYMHADTDWITARLTWVEVRRNLSRLLSGAGLDEARGQFSQDFRRTMVVELDGTTCEGAATIAEITGCRSIDALHLAALRRISDGNVPLLSFDVRQAQAARQLGITVVGA